MAVGTATTAPGDTGRPRGTKLATDLTAANTLFCLNYPSCHDMDIHI